MKRNNYFDMTLPENLIHENSGRQTCGFNFSFGNGRSGQDLFQ